MFSRILAVALISGLLVGLAVSVLQAYKVTPLILYAETFELGGGEQAGLQGQAHSHGEGEAGTQGAHDHGAWSPEDGLARVSFTAMTNILTSVGFAFLLVGAFVVSRAEVDLKTGIIWGLGGFVSFALAPAALLPPEVPGAAAAGLELRQILWVTTAISTAAGLALFVFARAIFWRAIGVALVALPLLLEAPHGEGAGRVPPELAAQFVAMSLVMAAVFWVLLGAVSGYLYNRTLREDS